MHQNKADHVTEWRTVAQVVTVARFRRPSSPRYCRGHLYHVWRWKAVISDPIRQPIAGMRCQCGALVWTHRP
jgi:hypothetical protein